MLLAAHCWLVMSLGVFSADPVVELAERDADYPLQGEYLAAAMPECACRFGMQVVALGEAKFEALMYEGGLPGNGASGISAYRLRGERSTSSHLRLEGGGWRAEMTDGESFLIDSLAGSLPVATLKKTTRTSPTLGAQPPANAVVLFDGSSLFQLTNAEMTEDGLLKVGAETIQPFRDFHLHAEFRTPYMPKARSQARGNSGFYLQRRYEVQVLDSFGQWPQFNEAASIYKTRPPAINLSYPPLAWQTYDIDFTAARFDALGNKTQHAQITVRHNGYPVQNGVTLYGKTGAGKPEGPDPLPILFQNHGDAVHFRNMWIVER